QRPCDGRTGELEVLVPPLLDPIRDERLAVALGGCRRSLEVAAAPGIAVAELEIRSAQVPAHRPSFVVPDPIVPDPEGMGASALPDPRVPYGPAISTG